VAPTNQEFMGPLRRKEDQGVVADIANAPKSIPMGQHIVAQVHRLAGNIGGLGWMS
jgi:hypothetical protein